MFFSPFLLAGDLVLLVHALCDPRQLHTTIATGRATDSGWVQSVDSFEDVGMETMTDVVKVSLEPGVGGHGCMDSLALNSFE